MASTRASEERRLDPGHAFDLGEAFERGALRLRTRELLAQPFELARGELRPPEPVVFVRDEGRRARDLVGTTYAGLRLVSERFLQVLRDHSLTGWATFPVEVWLSTEDKLDGYEGFAVTGRVGPIKDELSAPIELPPPVAGGRAVPGWRGLCFDPETWDGSDIFTTADRASTFVTEPVAQTLDDAGVTGVEFRRLTEIERPAL